MTLLTKAQYEQLLANGHASKDSEGGIDHAPVVKLFTPWAGATWLLSELYPNDPDVAFGLCDLGLGFPELGDVRLSEIAYLRGPGRLCVERDLHFTGDKALTAYAQEARQSGRINVCPSLVNP